MQTCMTDPLSLFLLLADALEPLIELATLTSLLVLPRLAKAAITRPQAMMKSRPKNSKELLPITPRELTGTIRAVWRLK